MELAQFKFSSGQEIVCEIMEYPSENSKEFIIRNAMAIVTGTSNGETLHMFRPWVHYLESDMAYVMVSTNHVVATTRPSRPLIEEYMYAVREMNKVSAERELETEQATARALQKITEAISQIYADSDEENEQERAGSNIIKFPSGDDILH
jgi:hypothetical protein